MWYNEFESETSGPRGMIFYEPLKTTVPENSQPYCCYIGTVIFYKKPWPGNLEKLDEVQSQWDLLGRRFSDELIGLSGVAPFVWHDSELYEIINGRVIWHSGTWHMRWEARIVDKDDRRLPFIKGNGEQLCQSDVRP